MQMAYAYEAYANNGVQESLHLITKIENSSGQTIYSYQPVAKQAVSARTAQIMTQLLEGVVQYGTGTQAQVPGWDVAGKTGTVQYDPSLYGSHPDWIRDAWFDGYTPTMLGSIYIGYDNPDAEHHMTDIPYASSWYCARIFGDIVKLATAGQTPQHFNFTAVSSSQPTQQQQPPVSGLSFPVECSHPRAATELEFTAARTGELRRETNRPAGNDFGHWTDKPALAGRQ